MGTVDDFRLLREYADSGSEAAFTELVSRRVDFVYSAALRQVGNADQAREIAQAVFILLARKAARIPDQVSLAGWLFRTTRFVALAQMRQTTRRRRREMEAPMPTDPADSSLHGIWAQLEPLLDDALASLSEPDRRAVFLRFFEGKSLAEIGGALGWKEDASRKRVDRALEKLRRYFTRRGIASTTDALAGAVATHGVQSAPLGLATLVASAALSKGAIPTSSTLTLIKGALKMMAWAKAKTAIGVGVGILLAAGGTTMTVESIQSHRAYSWQVPQADFETLHRAPAQVVIVPSRFRASGGVVGENDQVLGICQPLDVVAMSAYGKSKLRTVEEGELPKATFDFIAKVPGGGSRAALQAELKRKCGIVGRLEERKTNVLVLKTTGTAAPGLRPGTHQPAAPERGMTIAITVGEGQFQAYNQPVGTLITELENRTHFPIVDRSGLTNSYDMTMQWDEPDRTHPNLEGLKQALADQLGLELVPGRESIEMLVLKGEH